MFIHTDIHIHRVPYHFLDTDLIVCHRAPQIYSIFNSFYMLYMTSESGNLAHKLKKAHVVNAFKDCISVFFLFLPISEDSIAEANTWVTLISIFVGMLL